MLGVAEEVANDTSGAVGDTDGLGETGLLELLHALPGAVHGVVGDRDLSSGSRGIPPCRRVALIGVDVLESHGEVNQVQIKVVDSPELKSELASGLDVLVLVVGVPKLGDDEQVLALDETLLDGASDTLTALLFVSCCRFGSVKLSDRLGRLDLSCEGPTSCSESSP